MVGILQTKYLGMKILSRTNDFPNIEMQKHDCHFWLLLAPLKLSKLHYGPAMAWNNYELYTSLQKHTMFLNKLSCTLFYLNMQTVLSICNACLCTKLFILPYGRKGACLHGVKLLDSLLAMSIGRKPKSMKINNQFHYCNKVIFLNNSLQVSSFYFDLILTSIFHLCLRYPNFFLFKKACERKSALQSLDAFFCCFNIWLKLEYFFISFYSFCILS